MDDTEDKDLAVPAPTDAASPWRGGRGPLLLLARAVVTVCVLAASGLTARAADDARVADSPGHRNHSSSPVSFSPAGAAPRTEARPATQQQRDVRRCNAGNDLGFMMPMIQRTRRGPLWPAMVEITQPGPHLTCVRVSLDDAVPTRWHGVALTRVHERGATRAWHLRASARDPHFLPVRTSKRLQITSTLTLRRATGRGAPVAARYSTNGQMTPVMS